MSARSTIEWTDASWTPIRARNLKTGKVGWHCEHATTGCEFCYSEGFNKRLGTGLPFKPGHRKDIEIFLDDEMLLAPLRWKKPRMIFVCSMTDVFADFVSDEWIDKVFAVMALCPQHTFQVLTKRAGRMREYMTAKNLMARLAEAVVITEIAPYPDHVIADRILWAGGTHASCVPAGLKPWPLPNVWLGVSTERQQEADERIPLLLQTPAAVRFVSAEPLLGPLWLAGPMIVSGCDRIYPLRGMMEHHPRGTLEHPKLDWVICGGESGKNARPMHPGWARFLRTQCEIVGVPFFFKQWGHWSPTHPDWPNCTPYAVADDGTVYLASDLAYPDGPRHGEAVRAGHDKARLTSMYPLGKKAAGRHLDGVLHEAMPVTP